MRAYTTTMVLEDNCITGLFKIILKNNCIYIYVISSKSSLIELFYIAWPSYNPEKNRVRLVKCVNLHHKVKTDLFSSLVSISLHLVLIQILMRMEPI